MLSHPKAGWSDFQLDESPVYYCSYLEPLPLRWGRALLEALQDKCQYACLHIETEGEHNVYILVTWGETRVSTEESQYITEKYDLLSFSEEFVRDIRCAFPAWVDFLRFEDDEQATRDELVDLLEQLDAQIYSINKQREENRELLKGLGHE